MPNCGKRYNVARPGRYACRDCRAVLVEAAVPAAPPPAPPPLPPEYQTRADGIEARLKTDPHGRAAYLQLAQVYLDAGQKTGAIAALQRYLQIDPDNRFIRGRILQLEKRPDTPPRPVTGVGVGAGTARPGRRKGRRLQREPWAAERKFQRQKRLVLGGVLAVVVLFFVFLFAPALFPGASPFVIEEFSTTSPRWSPKGDRVAYIELNHDPHLVIYDLKRDTKTRLAKIWAWSGGYEWSPDGSKIAYVAETQDEDKGYYGEGVFVIPVSGGTAKRVGLGSSPSWGPDSTRLAYECQSKRKQTYGAYSWFGWAGGAICVVNVATAESEVVAESGRSPAFSPHGDVVVFAVREKRRYDDGDFEYDGRTMDEFAEDVLSGGAGNVMEANQALASEIEKERYLEEKDGGGGRRGQAFQNLWTVRPDGSGRTQLTFDSNSANPRWTASGSRLLFTMGSEFDPELWWMKPDGTGKEPLTGEAVAVAGHHLATVFDDDEKLLFRMPVELDNAGIAIAVTGAAPVDLYVVDVGGSEPRRLKNTHAFKQDFTLSPDGDEVVYEYTNPKTDTTELWRMDI